MTINVSTDPLGNLTNIYQRPLFITANRAPRDISTYPTSADIQPPGTQWQDDSVSPPQQYETTGAGNWQSGNPENFATITGNSGIVVVPDSNQNVNIVGGTNITTVGTANTLTVNVNGLTQYDVLVGGASSAITSVAPSATAGVPLISQGATSNPAFGTAVVAGGGTGIATQNAYAVLCGGTTATGACQSLPANGTSEQVLTSNGSSSLPTWGPANNAAAIVVSKTAGAGDYTTIASALAAATAGQTILITEGTYTENPTLVPGVNLVSFLANAITPNVTIAGKCSLTTAGVVSISGINLQTNNDYLLAVTGSANSVVNLQNCYLNCTNHTGISYTSSGTSSSVSATSCGGNLGTTGIAFFAATGANAISFQNCAFSNGGGSATANTVGSACALFANFTSFSSSLSMSSTSSCQVNHCLWGSGNEVAATIGNTSGSNYFYWCSFFGGTSSAMSVSASATASVVSCYFYSSNTNAITGSGTLEYTNIFFAPGQSSTVNTSTVTPGNLSTGVMSVVPGGPTITSGTGAPSASLPQGSLYLRTDGSSTSTRAYIATNGSGSWIAVTTAG